jgi:hypothetical protein
MILTAAEFLYTIQQRNINRNVTLTAMKKFAKYHVEQALKCASEEAESYVIGGLTSEVDKESILNAYPLTNIK